MNASRPHQIDRSRQVGRPYQVALAATLLVLALAIVGLWKIGPVVAVLSATHGVHAGDGLAAVPGLAALWLTGWPVRALRPRAATPELAAA